MKTFLRNAILAVALVAMVSGCKDDGPSSTMFVQNGLSRPVRIAILDFSNLAPRSDEAGRVVTNAVMTYLLTTGVFDIVEPGVVDQIMKEQRILPPPTGLDGKSCKQLQEALNVDAILTGTVEEYGEVRIGNETYPSVSFSARLINARDASIIWAGMVSKTGADKVLLFDIRRISSMGKLVKSAVYSMAESMKKDQGRILQCLRPVSTDSAAAVSVVQPVATEPAHGSAPAPAPATTPAVVVASEPTEPAAPAPAASTPAPAVSGGGKSKDEAKTYTAETLKALLVNVDGFTLKEVEHRKHYHDTVTAKYQMGDGPQFVEVKLVDYLKLAQTQKFLQTEHSGETVDEFGALPAYISTSEFGYIHIDVAVGRFGLFVSGPADRKADVEKLAAALVKAVE